MLRGLLAFPLALALIAPGATALAAEATTGYSQTTPPPTTVTTTVTTPPTTVTTTSTLTPNQKVKPEETTSTSKKTPKHGKLPTSTGSEVSTTIATPTTPHATTLPFTGLDLRWVIVAGMLLLGTGLSIMYVQRGRHGTGR
jgi:hypothetical protein